ncbi:hypothetical protein RhiirB3_423993 [Rhizophagus irregularis]|nr:hypothetical protein RhiirB3_423993 [Rhizophagus irregularis]
MKTNERQLKHEINSKAIFEWIPYNEFIYIEEIGNNCLITTIWKVDPLRYNEILCDLQNITDEFTNKSFKDNRLAQNPDTKDFILVFNNIYSIINSSLHKCAVNYRDTVFKWILYNNLIEIKEIDRECELATTILKDDPLTYTNKNIIMRKSYIKVGLKYLHNSQSITDEVESYLKDIQCYGLSQNPNTNYFILVLQLKYYCGKCGEKYSNQFEINNKNCISCKQNISINYDFLESYTMFEWIPYDQFYDIEEIGKGGFSTVYSSLWEKGFLYNNDFDYKGWKRKPNTRVALK